MIRRSNPGLSAFMIIILKFYLESYIILQQNTQHWDLFPIYTYYYRIHIFYIYYDFDLEIDFDIIYYTKDSLLNLSFEGFIIIYN